MIRHIPFIDIVTLFCSILCSVFLNWCILHSFKTWLDCTMIALKNWKLTMTASFTLTCSHSLNCNVSLVQIDVMCGLCVKCKERLNHHIEKITNHDQTHSIHWHCHIESNVVSLFLTTQWFLVCLCRHVNWCLSSILKWHSEPQQRHWIITLKWLQTNEETHFVCWNDHWWLTAVFNASFKSMCFVLHLHRHEDQCSFNILKWEAKMQQRDWIIAFKPWWANKWTHFIHLCLHVHIESSVVLNISFELTFFVLHLHTHADQCLFSIPKWQSKMWERDCIVAFKMQCTNEQTNFICLHLNNWSTTVFNISIKSMSIILCLHQWKNQCLLSTSKWNSKISWKDQIFTFKMSHWLTVVFHISFKSMSFVVHLHGHVSCHLIVILKHKKEIESLHSNDHEATKKCTWSINVITFTWPQCMQLTCLMHCEGLDW